MTEFIKKTWWVPLVRGIAAITFGILTLTWPGITLITLISLFAAFSLIDGVSDVVGAFASRKEEKDWWVMLLTGVAGSLLGVATLLWPQNVGVILITVIAIRAVVAGIVDIVFAIKVRKFIKGEVLMILGGLASIIFGIFSILQPAVSALAILSVIAVYAIVVGTTLSILSFRFKKWGKDLEKLESPTV